MSPNPSGSSAGHVSVLAEGDRSPATLSKAWAGLSLPTLLHQALSTFGDGLRVACSLGPEDLVILHEYVAVCRATHQTPQVFMLDTGRLHQETYDLLEAVQSRFGITIAVYFPEAQAVEALVSLHGPNGFYTSVANRKACCGARKMAPLARALTTATAWITGLRREQSANRGGLDWVEADPLAASPGTHRVKIQPLLDWTSTDVFAYLDKHEVPRNALHTRGYASIGCAPCTRAITPGEDERAGRWWWETDGVKECGLHPSRQGAGRETPQEKR